MNAMNQTVPTGNFKNEINLDYQLEYQNDLPERLQLFYRHTGITAIAAVVMALLVAIILLPVLKPAILVSWVAMIVLINLARYWTAKHYQPSKPNLQRLLRTAIFLSLIHGISWGGFALLVIVNSNLVYQAFMIAVIIGVASVATATTSYLFSANLAFIFPALAPSAVGLFLYSYADVHYGLSILVTTATAMLPFVALNIQHSFSATLQALAQNRWDLANLKSRHGRLVLKHQTLQQVNEKNRRFLESTNEGIIGVDVDGHCTFINPAGLELLGYTQQEILGVDIHKRLFHTRIDGTFYLREESPVFFAYHQGRSSRTDEDVMWRKNNSSFPAEYSVSPLFENSVISGAVIMFRDETNSRAMAKQLDYLANHDTLTGLHNRQAFEHKFREMLVESQMEGTHHVLCYLDLDQFKVINDTCGHLAGDDLLRTIADLLKKNIRHSDFLARLGGDEFGLLLNSCSLHQADPVVTKLVDTLRNFRFNWQDSIFATGVSIGMVEINEQTESIVSALSQADSACYMAKENGRNRIHVYHPDDSELAKRQGEMEWVSQIHDAFEEDRFFLMKQPIVLTDPLKTNGQHFEVLIRMKDKDGKTVAPCEFIPPAERYNLMPSLDRWVVRTVFKWLHDNPKQCNSISFCSINLSGQTVGDAQFQNFVVDCLAKYQVPGEKICFEITETTAIANITQAIKLIKLLKKQGCKIALDDFGSGMSSFSYLKSLDVDYLKIDGHFVRDMLKDHHNSAIVDAIHRVSQVMGIKTIAEFVENSETRNALEKIGVDYVQGYGISRPVDLDAREEQRLSLIKH